MDIFVDPTNGSDLATGTQSRPFRTLLRAIDSQRNGDRIILEDGLHSADVPIEVREIIQGQIRARNRGRAQLRVNTMAGVGGSVTLTDCEKYTLDGIVFQPPVDLLSPNGLAFQPSDISILRIDGGNGNLVQNADFDNWVIEGTKANWIVSAVSSTGCNAFRMKAVRINRIEVNYAISESPDFIPGGYVYGVHIGNTGTCSISDVRVHEVIGHNAGVCGIMTGVEDPDSTTDVVRIQRCYIEDVKTAATAEFDDNDNVTNSEGLDFAWGIGVMGIENGTDIVIDDTQVVRAIATHQNPDIDAGLTAGYAFLGARNTRLRHVLAYYTDIGISAQLVGTQSRWENVTVHRAQQGLVLCPYTASPIRVVARNVSLSEMDVGIVTYGPGTPSEAGSPGGGPAFLDIDFLNIYQVKDLVSVPGAASPATHFQRGRHFTTKNPRFVDPSDEGHDFRLEYVSPLINAGGEV